MIPLHHYVSLTMCPFIRPQLTKPPTVWFRRMAPEIQGMRVEELLELLTTVLIVRSHAVSSRNGFEGAVNVGGPFAV